MTGPVAYPAADGVEIKATLSGTALDDALASFGLRPAEAKQQQVWFFDSVVAGSGDLRLASAGVVLRLRRKKRSQESTVKLRPADPERLLGDFAPGSRRFDDYAVEYDWAREPVLSAAMGAEVDDRTADGVISSTRPVRALFSDDQLRLLEDAGTAPADPFAGLRVAGPIAAHRWEGVGTGDLADLRAEQWEYDGGRTFVEFSLRTADLGEARSVREALLAELARRDLPPDAGATSKTETVLRDLLDPQAPPRAGRNRQKE